MWRCANSNAYSCIDLWTKIQNETDKNIKSKACKYYLNSRITTGETTPNLRENPLEKQLLEKTITESQAIEICSYHHKTQAESQYYRRWITHILNRIAYEREQLGGTPLFKGQLTATILKAFAREYGADKPKATESGNAWTLSSSIPLPEHIANASEIELNATEWCLLMHMLNYDVPQQKVKQPPLLNIKADYLKGIGYERIDNFRQIQLTTLEYKNISRCFRGISVAECREFRFRICNNPDNHSESCAVFITDMKEHIAIASTSIIRSKKQ